MLSRSALGPADGSQILELIEGRHGKKRQNLSEILMRILTEPAACFHDREDYGCSVPSSLATDKQKILPRQGDPAHAIFDQVVVHALLRHFDSAGENPVRRHRSSRKRLGQFRRRRMD